MKKNLLIILLITLMPMIVNANVKNNDKVHSTTYEDGYVSSQTIETYAKCEYDLFNPVDVNHKLTTFSISFNSKSGEIVGLKYINTQDKEVNYKDLGLSWTIDYSGYKNDARGLEAYWNNPEVYNDIVKNYSQSGECADIYVHFSNENYQIKGTSVNQNAYPVSTNKSTNLYVSDDGINWEKPTGDNQNNLSTIKTVCEYNFGSTIGSATDSNHFNLDLTAEKIIGIEIHKDIKSNKACGLKGYSFSWDEENNYCYSKKSTDYNLHFSSPDDSNSKYDFFDVETDDSTLIFPLGASSLVSMNDLSVIIKKSTLLKIFESGDCIEAEKLYSYLNNDNLAGLDGWQFIITHDLEEAKASGEEIFDGNSTIDNSTPDFGDLPPIKPNALDCDSLLGSTSCETGKNCSPAFYLQIVFNVMKYVAIIIVILLSILDFTGAVTSQDNDILNKSARKLLIRLILCVVIFVLPTILEFIFTLIDVYSPSTCGIN